MDELGRVVDPLFGSIEQRIAKANRGATFMHSGLAGLIGRPDLSSGMTRELDSPRASSDAPGFQVSAAGDVTVGRLSAGTLGLLVIGLGLFYFWTRTHQA